MVSRFEHILQWHDVALTRLRYNHCLILQYRTRSLFHLNRHHITSNEVTVCNTWLFFFRMLQWTVLHIHSTKCFNRSGQMIANDTLDIVKVFGFGDLCILFYFRIEYPPKQIKNTLIFIERYLLSLAVEKVPLTVMHFYQMLSVIITARCHWTSSCLIPHPIQDGRLAAIFV